MALCLFYRDYQHYVSVLWIIGTLPLLQGLSTLRLCFMDYRHGLCYRDYRHYVSVLEIIDTMSLLQGLSTQCLCLRDYWNYISVLGITGTNMSLFFRDYQHYTFMERIYTIESTYILRLPSPSNNYIFLHFKETKAYSFFGH